ncbi:MAG: pyrimidine 5'-nucleotidase [Caulobacteraceae bacterium]|nr:pyrimidine 5'-nucleotidase [Caulobacter sp.]
MGVDLRHVDTWVFDLDNTLYEDGDLFLGLIGERMTAYVQRVTGLPRAEAMALQQRYLHEQGATLAGMVAFHGVDPQHFLDEVHEVSLDSLSPDPSLREALGRLPGRRLVFTNGSAGHARRVLEHLRLDDLFDEVFHLEAAGYTPKPSALAFERLIAAHAVTPATTAFFEDTPANLAPAAALGMTTVLVGRHAADDGHGFVDHRAAALVPFLERAQVATPAA